MRISEKKINPSLKKEIERVLSQAVADIRNLEEANQFLSDFLTSSESEAFARRLAIGYWLKKGRSYNNIKENLKVSSATIATVQEMLERPGFQMILKKIEAEEWANQWAEKIKKFVKK
jgi:TrpR-related protein YerC/YecD